MVLAALALVAGCGRAPPPRPAAAPRYTIGTPYQLGGLWSYPREDFTSTESGLASVLPDRSPGRRTANGEIHDPGALVAAHRTLQLPAIVRVTNLENGRQLAVRVNDRGPQPAGRLLGLSRRAALLLGVPEGGAAQVEVVVEAGPSRSLAASLPADFDRGVAVETAPAGEVAAEALAPLPGVRAAERVRSATGSRPSLAPLAVAEALPPERLPGTVSQGPARPGALVIEVGRFFRRDLAQRQAGSLAGLGARVEPVGAGRQVQWRVRLGPFWSVPALDAAVAGVLAAGLPEARVSVE